MKKTVIIEILLVSVMAILLSCAIIAFKEVADMNYYIYLTTINSDISDPNLVECTIKIFEYDIPIYCSIGILALIAAVATLAVFVIIAIRDILPQIKKRKTTTAIDDNQHDAITHPRAKLEELKKDE